MEKKAIIFTNSEKESIGSAVVAPFKESVRIKDSKNAVEEMNNFLKNGNTVRVVIISELISSETVTSILDFIEMNNISVPVFFVKE